MGKRGFGEEGPLDCLDNFPLFGRAGMVGEFPAHRNSGRNAPGLRPRSHRGGPVGKPFPVDFDSSSKAILFALQFLDLVPQSSSFLKFFFLDR